MNKNKQKKTSVCDEPSQEEFDLISRRKLLLLSMGLTLLPLAARSGNRLDNPVDWQTFLEEMLRLADHATVGNATNSVIAEQGLYLLQQLRLESADFKAAVSQAYESGNRYWLWQRMIKEENINGGILNIDSEQLVQLHDHPGATGMLRIISGEAEVWQFDRAASSALAEDIEHAELHRVSRRILKPGDTALLTPDSGNIHALRAVSRQCRMLDIFIPPYTRSQRSWFIPMNEDWFDLQTITCRRVPEDEYTAA